MPRPSRRSAFAAPLRGAALLALLLACALTGCASASNPETLFLSWDADPTTTLTVQWLGADPQGEDVLELGDRAVTAVAYSRDPAGPWTRAPVDVRPFPRTDALVYRARLAGLEPGRRVWFRLARGGPVLASRTAPARLDAPLVFAEGGDASASPANVDVNRVAASHSPLFVLLGGDLAYANAVRGERWAAWLREWREHMVTPDGDLVPLVTTIGNHEVEGGYGKARDAAPMYYALFGGLRDDRTYAALDFGDYLSLVLLDSGHTAAVGPEQAEWLAATLAARAERPHLFCAYHVPAWPTHRHPDARSSPAIRRLWVPLFERFGVDIAFEHHDHTYKRTHLLRGGEAAPDGVLYMGDGCWGRDPRPVKHARPEVHARAESLNHCLIVTIRPDGTRQVTAVDREGRAFDGFPEAP